MRTILRTPRNTDLPADLHRLKIELRALREELRAERADNPQAEKNLRFLTRELLSENAQRPGLIQRADEIPSLEVHYGRNDRMPIGSLPQSPEMAQARGWDGSVGVACHQFTSPDRSNVKYVSPDGHSEVIYDRFGNIVTAPEDVGTYNFSDSRRDPVGHFYQDVLPWLLWGNDEADSTDMRQRLRALVLYGSIEARQSLH